MVERKRHRDGAGWGPNGWIKHDLIKRVVGGQTAVLRMKFGDHGVIIDMHAGTGEGIEIAKGQPDLFRDNISDATPALACRFGREGVRPAKVILCESIFERRELLRRLYGNQAAILSSNARLTRMDLSDFDWAMVMNDPNGPSGHALEVMRNIAKQVTHSDFVINVNESALARLAGVNPDGNDIASNAALVRACREKAAGYAWMLDYEEWRERLGKTHKECAPITVNHRAMRGRLILISNFISDGVKKAFGRNML